MKRKIFIFMLTILMVFPAILLAGCFGAKTTSYLCALPEDCYEGDLISHIGEYTETWSLIHRTENIDGNEYLVHYVHYTFSSSSSTTTYDYLGVWNETKTGNDKWVVYKLNESYEWIKGTEGKDIDGNESYGTDKYYFDDICKEFNGHALEARGFQFNKERTLIEENEEYIEYDLGGDIFRISNNIYHICMYRDKGTDIVSNHEFTRFTFNESQTAIPHINTINLT